MREYYTIPNTANRTVTYNGHTWTLAEVAGLYYRRRAPR